MAEYRQGRLDSAIAVLEAKASKVMGAAPGLIVAMAQHRQGHKEKARKTLAAVVLAFDWRPAQADNHDAWICHILRREAEAVLLPNLQAFLEGNYQPRGNDERVALLGVCQFKRLHRTAAALYAGAFSADPRLADNLQAGHRYRAACLAALAAAAMYWNDNEAIPKLAVELKSDNVYLRLHAAQALDALGTRAAPARIALTAALNDPNEYVKRVAEHAIAGLPRG